MINSDPVSEATKINLMALRAGEEAFEDHAAQRG